MSAFSATTSVHQQGQQQQQLNLIIPPEQHDSSSIGYQELMSPIGSNDLDKQSEISNFASTANKKNLKTEYKSKFTPFDQYVYNEVTDSFVKQQLNKSSNESFLSTSRSNQNLSPSNHETVSISTQEIGVFEPTNGSELNTNNEPWYKEVIKRNEKANEYRFKSEVGHSSPLFNYAASSSSSNNPEQQMSQLTSPLGTNEFSNAGDVCQMNSDSRSQHSGQHQLDIATSCDATVAKQPQYRFTPSDYKKDHLIAHMANNNNFALPKEQQPDTKSSTSAAARRAQGTSSARSASRSAAQVRSRSQSSRRPVTTTSKVSQPAVKSQQTTPTRTAKPSATKTTTSTLKTTQTRVTSARPKTASNSTVTTTTPSTRTLTAKPTSNGVDTKTAPINKRITSSATARAPLRSTTNDNSGKVAQNSVATKRNLNPTTAAPTRTPRFVAAPKVTSSKTSTPSNTSTAAPGRLSNHPTRSTPSSNRTPISNVTKSKVSSSTTTPTAPSNTPKSIKTPKAIEAARLAAAGAAGAAAAVVTAVVATDSVKSESQPLEEPKNSTSNLIFATDDDSTKEAHLFQTEQQSNVEEPNLMFASSNEGNMLADEIARAEIASSGNLMAEEISTGKLDQTIKVSIEPKIEEQQIVGGVWEELHESPEVQENLVLQGLESRELTKKEDLNKKLGQDSITSSDEEDNFREKQQQESKSTSEHIIEEPLLAEKSNNSTDFVNLDLDSEPINQVIDTNIASSDEMAQDDQIISSGGDLVNGLTGGLISAEDRFDSSERETNDIGQSVDSEDAIHREDHNSDDEPYSIMPTMSNNEVKLDDFVVELENVDENRYKTIDLVVGDVKSEEEKRENDVEEKDSVECAISETNIIPSGSDTQNDLINIDKPDDERLASKESEGSESSTSEPTDGVVEQDLFEFKENQPIDSRNDEFKKREDEFDSDLIEGVRKESNDSTISSPTLASANTATMQEEDLNSNKEDEQAILSQTNLVQEALDEISSQQMTDRVLPKELSSEHRVATEEDFTALPKSEENMLDSSRAIESESITSSDEEDNVEIKNELLMNVADLMGAESKIKEEMRRKSELARQNSSPQSTVAHSEVLLSADQLTEQLANFSSPDLKEDIMKERDLDDNKKGDDDVEEVEAKSSKLSMEATSVLAPQLDENAQLVSVDANTKAEKRVGFEDEEEKDISCGERREFAILNEEDDTNHNSNESNHSISQMDKKMSEDIVDVGDIDNDDEQLKLSNRLTNSEDELILMPRNFNYSALGNEDLSGPQGTFKNDDASLNIMTMDEDLDDTVQLADGRSAAIETTTIIEERVEMALNKSNVPEISQTNYTFSRTSTEDSTTELP